MGIEEEQFSEILRKALICNRCRRPMEKVDDRHYKCDDCHTVGHINLYAPDALNFEVTQSAMPGWEACDICNGYGPKWEAVVADFSNKLIGVDRETLEVKHVDDLERGSLGNWALCDQCKGVMESVRESRNHDLLAKYAVSEHIKRGDLPESFREPAEDLMTQTYAILMENWTGEIIPYEVEDASS